MISAILGIFAVTFAIMGRWIGAVICGVLTLISMEVSRDERAHYRGRVNRDRYWAYGEEPDWKRKQRAEQRNRNGGNRR